MKDILVQVRRVEFGKSIKATADLTLTLEGGEITIRGLRVIHQEGKYPWVAFPTNSYKDSSGQMKNFNWLEMSRKLKQEIADEVLTQYKQLS
jgi:DNA-binding cell septation regulator SpoVG